MAIVAAQIQLESQVATLVKRATEANPASPLGRWSRCSADGRRTTSRHA
jgi:hypothetical protein